MIGPVVAIALTLLLLAAAGAKEQRLQADLAALERGCYLVETAAFCGVSHHP
jgi:hypothetical protein